MRGSIAYCVFPLQAETAAAERKAVRAELKAQRKQHIEELTAHSKCHNPALLIGTAGSCWHAAGRLLAGRSWGRSSAVQPAQPVQAGSQIDCARLCPAFTFDFDPPRPHLPRLASPAGTALLHEADTTREQLQADYQALQQEHAALQGDHAALLERQEQDRQANVVLFELNAHLNTHLESLL